MWVKILSRQSIHSSQAHMIVLIFCTRWTIAITEFTFTIEPRYFTIAKLARYRKPWHPISASSLDSIDWGGTDQDYCPYWMLMSKIPNYLDWEFYRPSRVIYNSVSIYQWLESLQVFEFDRKPLYSCYSCQHPPDERCYIGKVSCESQGERAVKLFEINSIHSSQDCPTRCTFHM